MSSRVLILLTMSALTAAASPYTFAPVIPCAGCAGAAFGINNAGRIVGVAFDSVGGHGFVGAGGIYNIFDAPGAVFTEGTSINEAGVISGDAFLPDGTLRAFHRETDGSIAYLPYFAGISTSGGTLNNTGMIVGNYAPDPFGFEAYGFIVKNSTVTSPIAYPGAPLTQLGNSNDAGIVAGYYLMTPTGPPQSFLLLPDGTFQDFAIPGAIGTQLYDINNLGHLAGGYFDAAGVAHGFLYRDGQVITLDHTGPNTIAWALNDLDQVVGASFPAGGFFTGPYDGFVANPIPEPSAIWLCLPGLAGIVIANRRRRRSTTAS